MRCGFPRLFIVLVPLALGADTPENARKPANDAELRSWLENMVWHHGFSRDEIHAATGLEPPEIDAALTRFGIRPETRPMRRKDAALLVLPYPGGRHPRIGFLEGAIRPQRETKVSVFTPWDDTSYAVADVPEAIWSNLGLTYLAHTHIPTIWDQQNIKLPPLEWTRQADGSLTLERTLPNKITFGTRVVPAADAVRMEQWLTNGTGQPLTDLRVQNCVMLKGAKGFEAQTNDNKVFQAPYAAARSADGKRWVITAWVPNHRTWGNAPCPCLHSDPRFPDCPPGETRRLKGWLSFYEGEDLPGELKRIDATGWHHEPN
jgi:hypothetical protein